MNKRNIKFKFEMTYGSFIKLTTYIGFLSGFFLIPIFLLTNMESVNSGDISFLAMLAFTVIGSPISLALNGLVMGLFGYLPYKWFTSKFETIYIGRVLVNED